jgi:hypothetical protein
MEWARKLVRTKAIQAEENSQSVHFPTKVGKDKCSKCYGNFVKDCCRSLWSGDCLKLDSWQTAVDHSGEASS